MTRTIDNNTDVIDSRDVIARIEELQGERDDFVPTDGSPSETWAECNPDDAAELAALEALAEEASGYAADWEYGETLIRDSYFTEYAQELAEDIGTAPKDNAWPGSYIDWDAAARALQQDYTAVDFDGVTYWVR